MEESVCRFCFSFVKNEFEVIDAAARQMLEVLLLNVDLEASKNPILCPDCAEIIKKSYFFKTVCMDTEKIILTFSITKDGAKFDMRDVYKHSKDVVDEDLDICRFCMNQIGSSCVSIDKLMKDVMYIDMFSIYMPQMDLNVIKDPVICTSCWENLESYFKFAQKCLDTEEKIIEYHQNEATNSTSQIKLSNILGLAFKDTSGYVKNCTKLTIIKQESLCDDIEQIKQEPVDIKDVKVNLENSCEDRTVEMYKCVECTYETKYKGYLKDHVLIHKDVSEVEMHKCTICTFETKYRKHLKSHMLVHKATSEVQMHKCGICTYETKHKSCLKIHMLRHKDKSEIEMHKCEICTYESRRKNNLKTHMLKHTNTQEVKMYKCTICTFETKYKTPLYNHVLQQHKDSSEVEMHKCRICTFQTRHKYHLKRHLQMHFLCGNKRKNGIE